MTWRALHGSLRKRTAFSVIRSFGRQSDGEIMVIEELELEGKVKCTPRRAQGRELAPGSDNCMVIDSLAYVTIHKGHTVQSEFSPEPLEELPRSSLNKFAFRVPLSRGTVRSTPRILPESESNESTRGTVIRNRKRARLSAIGVSENTMSKLQRCVCCEGQWKIKKSIYEKLNHIEACAKQHAHTLEMVSILIKRELKMTVETSKQENTDLPRSHLEEVVQDVSKRKSRSKKESTLEEFSSQKRVDAMKRLRAILRTSNLDDIDIGLPSSFPVTFLPSRLLQSRRQAELSLSPEKTFHVSCL